MSVPMPADPDDPRHVAHLFGDNFAAAVPDIGEVDPVPPWEALDAAAIEDWQTLFARVHGTPRGAA